MTTSMPPLTRRPEWTALQDHYRKIQDVHLRTLFAGDPQRGERLTLEAAGLYLDYSKHRITDETLRLLVTLAESSGLRHRIDAMFRGDKINVTEQRPVLHVALRAPRGQSIVVDGLDVVPEVHAVLDRMASPRAARTTSPPGSSRPCATSSAATSSARPAAEMTSRADALVNAFIPGMLLADRVWPESAGTE